LLKTTEKAQENIAWEEACRQIVGCIGCASANQINYILEQ